MLVIQDQLDLLDPQVLQDHKVQPEIQDQRDLRVQREQLEPPEMTEQQVLPDLLDLPVQQDLRAQQVQMEQMAIQDQQVLPVLLELKVQRVQLDLLVVQVQRDQMDQPDLLVPQDQVGLTERHGLHLTPHLRVALMVISTLTLLTIKYTKRPLVHGGK
tara:strand:- start:41 stop:514 length:474 start_codon:yes stop_codon:yes gene_type:complete